MATTTTSAAIDEAKLQAFLGKAVGDSGTAASAALVMLGDRLGLYRAMADGTPLTSVEVAQRTGTTERYVREWLINQAGASYVEYDTASGRYRLPPEHALALTDESSPFYVGGGYQVITSVMKAEPRIAEAFRSGASLAWGDQDPGLFVGTKRFFKPGYVANLVASWIPALDGVEAKLQAGATVADVGCGHGASTIIPARAFPRSRFVGFDNHGPAIERARQTVQDAGVSDRVAFDVASATDYPGSRYDLIAFFYCLHDMGDPVGAIRHASETPFNASSKPATNYNYAAGRSRRNQ